MHKVFLFITLAVINSLSNAASLKPELFLENQICAFTFSSKKIAATDGGPSCTREIQYKLASDYTSVTNNDMGDHYMDNNLESISYSGDYCLCVIQLWSLPNSGGETTTIQITNSEGTVELDETWSNQASSFIITC